MDIRTTNKKPIKQERKLKHDKGKENANTRKGYQSKNCKPSDKDFAKTLTMRCMGRPSLFKNEAIPIRYPDVGDGICAQCHELVDNNHMCRQFENVQVQWLDVHANQRRRTIRAVVNYFYLGCTRCGLGVADDHVCPETRAFMDYEVLEEPQHRFYHGCVRCGLEVVEDHVCPETKAFMSYEESL